MAEQKRRNAGAEPISRHPMFPAIVALWFGAAFGLISIFISSAILERGVLALGIDQVIPMAAPPLGTTTRILMALGMIVVGAIVGFIVARRIAKAPPALTRTRTAKKAEAAVAVTPPGTDTTSAAASVTDTPEIIEAPRINGRRRALALNNEGKSPPSVYASPVIDITPQNSVEAPIAAIPDAVEDAVILPEIAEPAPPVVQSVLDSGTAPFEFNAFAAEPSVELAKAPSSALDARIINVAEFDIKHFDAAADEEAPFVAPNATLITPEPEAEKSAFPAWLDTETARHNTDEDANDTASSASNPQMFQNFLQAQTAEADEDDDDAEDNASASAIHGSSLFATYARATAPVPHPGFKLIPRIQNGPVMDTVTSDSASGAVAGGVVSAPPVSAPAASIVTEPAPFAASSDELPPVALANRRIAEANLEDLSHMELLERLALAMSNARAEAHAAAKASALAIATATATAPATSTTAASFAPPIEDTVIEAVPEMIAPPATSGNPSAMASPMAPADDLVDTIEPAHAEFISLDKAVSSDVADNDAFSAPFAAPFVPPFEAPELNAPAVEAQEPAITEAKPTPAPRLISENLSGNIPAGLRPVSLDHGDDSDVLPSYIPPRHIGLAAVPTPKLDEPSGSAEPIAFTTGPFSPPSNPENGLGLDSNPANSALDQGYSSLRTFTRSTASQSVFAQALDFEDDAEEDESFVSSVHNFELNRQANTSKSSHAPFPAEQAIAPEADDNDDYAPYPPENAADRLFDAPDRTQHVATERALQDALATLKRMSGAA